MNKSTVLVALGSAVVTTTLILGTQHYVREQVEEEPKVAEAPAVPPSGYPRYLSKAEKECLVQNVYHEARGESIKGQIAVVYTTLNRSLSETRKYGATNNICDIVKAPYAFSWYDGTVKAITNPTAWNKAVAVVESVLVSYSLQNSPVKDATHYVNKKKATAKVKWWKSKKMVQLAQLENHEFYKQKNEKVAIKKA